MKITLDNSRNRIIVDGKFFGHFDNGCRSCALKPYVLHEGKKYKMNEYNVYHIEKAVKEIICMKKQLAESRSFAECVIEACEECMKRESVLIEN